MVSLRLILQSCADVADGWEEWDDGTEEHLDNEAQDFKQLESEGQEARGVKHIHAEHDHAHVGHKAKKTKV